MPILLVCWFLFAFPLMLAGAFLLGARVYHCGMRQESPGLSIPRFGFTRSNDNGHAEVERQRLPEV